MRPKMPTLGSPPKRKSPTGVFLVFVLIAAAVGGVGYWRHHRKLPTAKTVIAAVRAIALDAGTPASANDPATQPPSAAGTSAATAPAPSVSGTIAAAPGRAEPAPGALGTPTAATAPTGPRAVSLILRGPLETAVDEKVGEKVGPALAEEVRRELVWWIDFPGDLRRGDELDFLWEPGDGPQPQVDAVRLVSAKYGKTFEAFRYQKPGDRFARFYQPDGAELERRLVASPLDDYEQITSLLKDGRHHKGVDFKTPEGSPVRATFTGTITRKNWKWRLNGNCLELTEAAAPHRRVLYLHLSPIPKSLHVGEHVEKGEVIAQSGNTGHSFAPHLHYQLMAGERVLDPFDAQATTQRSLTASERVAFERAAARLSSLLGPEIAHN